MVNKDDNPTFLEAVTGPDAARFMEAMKLELSTLVEMKTFDIVDKVPWMKILSSVWAFKRKIYPDGSIRRLKARLCTRGFEQREGIDYFETFAPVVQWLTVRLILIMTILINLETKQIDYTSAFVQAKIDTDAYMEMPRGFLIPGKVWHLKKSIYGLKQSSRNYYLHMKEKLSKLGFHASEADSYLFVSANIICLLYVDDSVSTNETPKEENIQPRISRVRDVHFPFSELPTICSPERVPQEIISSPEGAPPEEAPISSPEGAPQTPILPPTSSTHDAKPSANPPASPAPTLRRLTRTRWIPDRLTMFGKLGWSQPNASCQTNFKCNSCDKLPRATGESQNNGHIANLQWQSLLNICTSNLGTLGSFVAEHQQQMLYGNLINYLYPALLITMANKDDNSTFLEAVTGQDAARFMEAMKLELSTLVEMKTFNIVDKAPWMKTISSVWAFKRKIYPDGSIRRLKARLCARGFE